MDCLASSTEPDIFELRRGLATSAAKVEAQPRGRCRKGDILLLPVDFPEAPIAPLGGLTSSFAAIFMDSVQSALFSSRST